MTKSNKKKGSKPLSRKTMKKTVGGLAPLPSPMPVPMMKKDMVGLAPLPSPMPVPMMRIGKINRGDRE